MLKAAIFASGNGTNFEAIVQANLDIEIALLVCDQKDAYVIKRAEKYHIPTLIVDYQEGKAKAEQTIINKLEGIDFIILAGYLRVLSNNFIKHFSTIINVHPSLLPKYKGLNAIEQALNNNEEYIGVTIHHVNELVDDGQIIKQDKVNINGLSEEEVYQKVHQLEHKLYIEVIKELTYEK